MQGSGLTAKLSGSGGLGEARLSARAISGKSRPPGAAEPLSAAADVGLTDIIVLSLLRAS